MFLDITHYKSKRKGRRGPIPKEGVRTPAGRLSRAAEGGQHMVYFIALEGGTKIKVGRTRNIKRRINTYRHSSGCEARCLAQLLVAGYEDSLKLENSAITYLQGKYERAGREWFDIPEASLAAAIADIVASAGIDVELRGAPGMIEPDSWAIFDYGSAHGRMVASAFRINK